MRHNEGTRGNWHGTGKVFRQSGDRWSPQRARKRGAAQASGRTRGRTAHGVHTGQESSAGEPLAAKNFHPSREFGMSLASFTIGGITAYIEENEDREGVYVHLEAGRKWGTLHCVEATGEWSSGDEEVSARELQTLEKIREKAEQIMDANGWEE